MGASSKVRMKMNKAKVLVLDIETSPLLVYVWGLKEQFITIPQIKKDWFIMAWSAKWLEDSKSLVYYDLRNRKAGDDRPILIPLWKMLNEADIVITQNGQQFDSKKINARFMLNGIKPPKPFAHHDTYQIVKKVASFTSNSLEYLTNKFCKTHKKLSHAKFSGWKLWAECLNGNISAWNEMKKYNIEDVLSTEEFYLKIRSWVPETLPKVFALTDSSSECGTCGYYGKMKEGRPRHAKTRMYKQHSCPKCGSWQRGSVIKGKEV